MEVFTRRILRLGKGKAEERVRGFPAETPVAIYVNSALLTTVSATPAMLEELAVGFMFTERIISGLKDVSDLSAMADSRRGQVWVTLRGEAKLQASAMVTSGCGRGITFLCASDLDSFPKAEGGSPFAAGGLYRAMESLRESAVTHRAVGGIHAAGCAREGRLESIAEDVGRHNAVDKSIGSLLRRGLSPGGTALVTTGRISSEMVLKAAVSGCPLVASMTGATSLAVEAADRLMMTVAAYVRGDRMDVCTHPERIQA